MPVQRLASRRADGAGALVRVAVVALGKIGLPLAVQVASKGHHVVGVDIDPRVVEHVNGGVPPFPGEHDLDRRLAQVVNAGNLSAVTDASLAVAEADVVVIVVPLLVDRDARPDFRAIDAATGSIASALRPDTLVSYETTLPVGTTRNRFVPALAAASGIDAERLLVCHSPERVYSGRVFADLRRYPKLVGGVGSASAARAVAFYESALDFDERPDLPRPNGVWDVRSAEAAELAKLAETTYRDVNIALANEFAKYADRLGIDFSAVREASNSQPFSHLHSPGIAVGGHCIPVYPRFYLEGDPSAQLPAVSRSVNDSMPRYAAEMLERELRGLTGKAICVLGVSYRGGVKETAFSGAFALVRELKERGAAVAVADPMYSDSELQELGFQPREQEARFDALVIQADHPSYRDLCEADFPGAAAVLDGRGIVDPDRFPGAVVLGIGRGTALR